MEDHPRDAEAHLATGPSRTEGQGHCSTGSPGGSKGADAAIFDALLNGTSHPAPTSGIEYPSSILLQVCC